MPGPGYVPGGTRRPVYRNGQIALPKQISSGPGYVPEEDYSESGAFQRARQEVAYDSAQEYYADYPVVTNAAPNPREYSAILRYQRANANRLILSQIPDTLDRYPSLVDALAEADIDERDARRLVNLAEMDSAFNAITATTDPIRQRNIVLSMNPVQRAAFFDYFTAKAEELQNEAAKNPGWAEQVWDGFYENVFEPIINGLVWANHKSQQAWRGGLYGIQEGLSEGDLRKAGASFVAGSVMYWDEVAPGTYNQETLEALRAEYGADKVNALLRLEELKRDGEPDAYGRWIAEYVNTPLENLVRNVTWSKYADPTLLELARKINAADQGNTGMLLLSPLPDDWSGDSAYDVAAGALNITATLALDPTLFAAKGIGVYRAARYGLTKLSTVGGVDSAFRMRRTRVFFDSLGKDLARIDNLEPAKAAIARDVMRRQYGNYLPPQVIDDMADFGVRSADDAQRWFTSKYVAEQILAGIGVGDKFGTTFEQIARATNLAKRQPLMPGKTTAGVIRSRIRLLAAIHNPVNTRFAERFSQRFDDASDYAAGSGVDAAAYGSRLSDDAAAYGVEQGVIERTGPLGEFARRTAAGATEESVEAPTRLQRVAGAVGYRYTDKSMSARLDRINRRFARAPIPTAVYMNDGRDAGLIYDWARAFMTRQDAAMVENVWRTAESQAVRKQIFNGLVKTHAAAKGVMLKNPQQSWRDFLPEVKRGGTYSPTLQMRRTEDGMLVWDRTAEAAAGIDDELSAFAAAGASSRALSQTEDIVSIRPSDFNGQQYPLHLWQTSDYVKIPNFAELEKAGVRASFLGAAFGLTHGKVAQRIVDTWSLFTLAGPRYYLRNSLEDYVFYAMTEGQWRNLYKGRRFGTALRDVRGKKLGIVNRLMRGKARPIDDPDFSTKWSLIKSNFTAEDRVAAMQAMKEGDLSKVRDLVALAMSRSKLTGWSKANQDDLMDFVTEHGAKLLDEVNEEAMFGVSALMPGSRTESYKVIVDPLDGASGGKLVRPSREWGDVSPIASQDNPLALSSWLRDLKGVTYDGPIGQAALKGIYFGKSDEELIPQIAGIIRNDKTMKYTDRLAAFHTANASPEQFAARYVSDVRNMVSRPDGTPNEELLKLMRGATAGDAGIQFVMTADGLSVKNLAEIKLKDRPTFILGQKVEEVPVVNSIKGFDRLWAVMGEQYARLSREPIFLANYLEQRTILRPYEQQMASMFGAGVARQRASRLATDRAYGLTLSYTDNPLNRTMLAWNSRNVARYYRATEDFARRALRVTKNYPQGFWKVGLTYDALEDTGFVYTDENGEKYFMFPGTDITIGLVNAAINKLPMFNDNGVFQLDSASYEMRGYVRMLSPSADPYQWLPTLSSPIAAIGVKSLMAAFPMFNSLEQALLGEYGENADFWQAMMPSHAMRGFALLSTDERSSVYASAFKDAVQVSAAAGAMPAFDAPQSEWDDYQRGLGSLVRSMIISRAILGIFLPAAPRLTATDVTEFAREGGILNMDAAFREMIRVAYEEGSQNPFADGLTKYVETFGLDAVPYTLSTSEANDQFGSLTGLTSVAATVEGEQWVKENYDLVEGRYKTASMWLMPRLGEYSADQNQWLRKAGMKIPARYEDLFNKARVAEGKYVYYMNRDLAMQDIDAAKKVYYDAVVADDETAADDAWAEVRRLEDEWSGDGGVSDKIKSVYPELKVFDNIELANGERLRLLDIEIRPMLDYVLNDRDKPAPPGAQNMADAIATFDAYQGEIGKITGQTAAETLDKRMLKIEAQQMLTQVGERDPNTKFFVDAILIPMMNQSYTPLVGSQQ